MNKTLAWLLVAGVLLIEYGLFRHYAFNNIIFYYPSGIDQANYLYASYSLYENMLHKGLLNSLITQPLFPTSFLFCTQAGIFFLLFGASRISALTLNFLYFAGLQIVVFQTLKKLLHNYIYGFLFIGLLLATESYFLFGGVFDFRIDFMAFCLYGIFVCFILRSEIFANHFWVFGSAFVAIILILTRFITITYIVGIIVPLLAYYLNSALFQKNPEDQNKENWQRIKNLILFGIIVFCVVLPILWLHHQLLVSYYFNGHVVSLEKMMRAKMVGVDDIFSNLIFYPKAFVMRHLTLEVFVQISLILALLCGIYYLFYKRLPSFKDKNLKNNILFLVISIIVPLIILTMDMSKSALVISIILPSFLLLVVFIISIFFRSNCELKKVDSVLSVIPLSVLYFITLLFFASGMLHFIWQSKTHESHPDSMAIRQLINDIGNYAEKSSWKNIYASADKYTDFFISIPAYYYEVNSVLLNFTPGFGAYSQQIIKDETEALEILNKTNLFLSLEHYQPDLMLLFEDSIKKMRPKLRENVKKNFIELGCYDIADDLFEVYVKSN